MKYLLFLLALPAFASWQPSGDHPFSYSDQATCEKDSGRSCFEFIEARDGPRELLVQAEDGSVVIDEKKKEEKVAKDATDKESRDWVESQCDLFKMLMGKVLIDKDSKPEDVQEVTWVTHRFGQYCILGLDTRKGR